MQKLFGLQILLFFQSISGFLDFEELNSINYGINLLDTPIVRQEDPMPNELLLTSIHGQQYHCSYPAVGEERKKEKEDEQVAVETGISELLKPMSEGPCLIYNKGWWTYEFCYGKEIKQYHLDNDQKIVGPVIMLGYYDSEFDWNNASEKKKSSLNRYHSQQYVNGTACDLTGKLRKTEVRFQCEEGSGDHISRIDEPETCGYIIIVQTTKICHHPYLKPAARSRPVPITCQPLLSQDEFDDYQAEKEAEKMAKEAAVQRYKEAIAKEAEELKNSQKIEEVKEQTKDSDIEQETEETEEDEEDGEEESLSSHKGVSETMNDLQKMFSESLSKSLQEMLEQHGLDEKYKVNDLQMDMRVVEDPDDVRKVMTDVLRKQRSKVKVQEGTEARKETEAGEEQKDEKTVKENAEDEDGALYQKTTDDSSKTQTSNEEQEEEKEEDEDKDILEDFKKGLQDALGSDERKARMAKYKDNIDSAIQAQFADIVEEAERELAAEGEAPDGLNRKETYKEMASTLGKMLKQLGDVDDEEEEVDDEGEEGGEYGEEEGEDLVASRPKQTSSAEQSKETTTEETTLKFPRIKASEHATKTKKAPETLELSTKDKKSQSGEESTNELKEDRPRESDPIINDPNENDPLTNANHGESQHTVNFRDTDSAPIVPVPSDPSEIIHVENEVTKTNPPKPLAKRSDLLDSNTKDSDHLEPGPSETDTPETDPLENDPLENDPVENDPVENDLIENDPIENDPTENDPTENDPNSNDPNEDERAEPPSEQGVIIAEKNEEGNSEIVQIHIKRVKSTEATDIKGALVKGGDARQDHEGRKVEVRIITAGYYNDEDGAMHFLSDDDSSTLSKMVFAIIGNNDEEVREAQRQEQIESAYNFRWNKKSKKPDQ